MGDRLELQTLLESVLGSSAVYFQPPPTFQMNYPCIVYHRVKIDSTFASNDVYGLSKRYQVVVIDKDPDSLIPDKVANLPKCSHDRRYTYDNLNHDVFNIYF